MISKELSAFARFDPRKARHHRNPRVALSVIGLDMLTENPELGRLFVRLNMESKLRLIEDFEDGSYVDLFELRKNEKRQMHARAKERAAQEDTVSFRSGRAISIRWVAPTRRTVAASARSWAGTC